LISKITYFKVSFKVKYKVLPNWKAKKITVENKVLIFHSRKNVNKFDKVRTCKMYLYIFDDDYTGTQYLTV